MSLITPVYALGEIVGAYVYTDIVAYINGRPVRSYNIDGWTGIVAEDLRNFGFDVYWNADERTLEVGNSYFYSPENWEQDMEGYGEVNRDYFFETNSKPVGTFAGNIYNTDIKTFVAGDEVKAFNIGGQTIIYIDELIRFGDVVWNEEERKICYDYVKPWSIELYEINYEADTSKNINSFSLNTVKGENEYITTGENLNYIDYLRLYYNKKDGMSLGFSIYQRVLFQTEELHNLLWDISTVRYDGEILREDLEIANKHMKILINGEPVVINKVTQGKGSGHTDFYFHFDKDMKKEDINSVSVTFR